VMWLAEQDLVCGGCGHRVDESMDPENEDRYTAKAVVCHACRARDRANQEAMEDPESLSGRYWTTELRR
jgi:hypothetical protein